MTLTTMPTPGARLTLTVVRTGGVLVSLVDDDDAAGGLWVFAPLGADGLPVTDLPVGTAVLVAWTSASGRHEQDATLLEVRPGSAPLWRLRADGPARTAQLRRFTRASEDLPAALHSGTTSRPAVVSDLSEGGARLVVDVPRSLAPDDAVVLEMTVEGQPLRLPGRLLPFRTADVGRTELRVEFDELGRVANLLRRHVLGLQIRARAAAKAASS